MKFPKQTHDNKQAYIDYIDKHVQAYLPSKKEDAKLHEMYQKHSQFKICGKYKNIQCKFNIGQFLQILQLLQNHYAMIWIKLIKLTFWRNEKKTFPW